jgi:uncharacterized iron-regulated protein
MKKYVVAGILFIACSLNGNIFGQKLEAYRIFNAKNRKVNFEKLLAQTEKAEIILFGELHNNPISHWLQLELTQRLFELKKENLVLGMEMFEADDQLKIDEFFAGHITERNFEQEARLWRNYKTDYKPILEFARTNNLRLVATNVPRRYASLVNRQGFEGLESLNEKALQYIAPLPIAYDPDLPGYKSMLEMTGMPAHTSQNFPKAQAIKDATMAYFILQNFMPGKTFIHYHGAFHSNNYEGIMWYLQQTQPSLKIITISCVEQNQLDELDEENIGIADFIIVIPETMTKTY